MARYVDTPTTDAEPVKRGSWVSESQDSAIYCSECGDSALLNGCEDYEKSNYCPNCGAKMED